MKSTRSIKCLSLLMLMFLLAIGCGKDKATSPEPTGPKVIRVSPDGTGDYPTIQAAIDSAANGDIIELADGTFTGDGNWDIDYHGKAITVRSQSNDRHKCIIDCYDSTTTSSHRGFYFNSGEGTHSILEGVLVTNGDAPGGGGGAVFCAQNCSTKFINCFFRNSSAEWGGGMYCDFSSPSLTDCYFEGNRASYGGGLYCSYSSPSIDNCTFSMNEATGGGIFLSMASRPRITHCTFKWNNLNHNEWKGGGIFFSSSHAHIENVTFFDNAQTIWCDDEYSYPHLYNTIIASGRGLAVGGSTIAVVLRCCDLYGNSGGNWLGIEAQYGVHGNISENPLFCHAEGGDLRLQENSPCAPSEECDLMGAWPVGCD